MRQFRTPADCAFTRRLRRYAAPIDSEEAKTAGVADIETMLVNDKLTAVVVVMSDGQRFFKDIIEAKA